jgi:hypothetical protein
MTANTEIARALDRVASLIEVRAAVLEAVDGEV